MSIWWLIMSLPRCMPSQAPRADSPNDVAPGILAETALGPLYIGGSFGDSGHHKWFLQIGKAF